MSCTPNIDISVVLSAQLWFLLRLVTSMKTITVLLIRLYDIVLMNSLLPINGRELVKAWPRSFSWTCLHFYLMEFTPIDFHCNQHDIDPASPWAKRLTVFWEKKTNEEPVLSSLRVWDFMWPPDRIPRCCGRSIHTWCLFTSHLCYPSWACCRWIHAWHPAMPMFFFADSVREVLITQSLLQGGHLLPDWQNCEMEMLWHKGNFNLWDFTEKNLQCDICWETSLFFLQVIQ